MRRERLTQPEVRALSVANHCLIACYNSVSSMYSICLFTEIAKTITKIMAIKSLRSVDGMKACVDVTNGPAKPPDIAPR